MAEKPRIKETDAIYDSIGKKRVAGRPSMVQSDVMPPPMERLESDTAGDDSTGKRRGRPRKNMAGDSQPDSQAPSEQPEPSKVRDAAPLDFSKYELPQKEKRRGRPRKDVPSKTAPDLEEAAAFFGEDSQLPPTVANPFSAARRREASAAEEPLPLKKTIVRAEELQAGAVREFSFTDLEEEQRLEAERKKQAEAQRVLEQKRAEQARLREEMTRQELRDQEELEQIRRRGEEEAERARALAAEEAERKLREAAEEAARLRKQAEEEAERLRRQAEAEAESLRREKESRRKLLEDDGYREDVLDQLGNEFEQQFSKVFDDPDAVKKEKKPWWLAEKRIGLGKAAPPEGAEEAPAPEEEPQAPEPESDAPQPLPPLSVEPYLFAEFGDSDDLEDPDAALDPPSVSAQEQDFASGQEAEDFMRSFEQEVLQEENGQEHSGNFRETLARKFMREREQYIQELGIADLVAEEEAREEREEAEARARLETQPPGYRKLDFQIRPEMHMAQEDLTAAPPPDPVRPALPLTYNRSAQAQPQLAAEPPPDQPTPEQRETKSAEDLILELGRMNKRREQNKSPKAQRHFNFRFTSIDEDGENQNGRRLNFLSRLTPMGKVVALSACAGVLVLAVLVWALMRSFAQVQELVPPASSAAASDVSEEAKIMLDSLHPESVMRFNNVTVKRSGLSFSNLIVHNSLVVEEDASAEGSLSLADLSVGEMIYIKPSGINRLDLKGVTAPRVVINNSNKDVAVYVSGASNIGVIEIRTPATIYQTDLADESPGVRTVQLAAQGETPLAVGVNDAKLTELNTTGETQLAFTGASVETLSAQGNLTLSGSGKVNELNFGVNAGGGAAEDPPVAYPASILVKGVDVAKLNLKSSATVNLNAQVDAVYASDPLILGGNGTVGHLVLNAKFGNGRLTADISGLNIQQLTTNTQTLFYSRGSSTINNLVANESTWALGNKVNKLTANADGVIYENEPDAKQIAQGVAPPESKADNPNLNYNLNYDFSADGETSSTDATQDAVATTCEHSRDVGGFTLGDGSRQNPFMVESPAQLAHVAQHPASHFLQSDDISISSDPAYVDGFPMIGTDERFSGVYDGAGYEITDLRIYGEGEDSVGLFAANEGTIRNLSVSTGEILCTDPASVGGLVGTNYSGAVVESCSNGATIDAGNSLYTGGVVGYNYAGKVRDCYNTGKILGNAGVGGIVGMNFQEGSVTSCYNVGAVSGNSEVGAVVGVNEAVVTNCYFLAEEETVGVGSGEGVAVSKTAEQLSGEQMAADLKAGSDNSLWQPGSPDGYNYPSLKKPTDATTA